MKNKSNIFNKFFTLLVILSLSGQSVAFAQAPLQQDKLRIGYNDATGKVSFIGADPSKPIAIRSAQVQGLSANSSARAMIAPYAADFGLKNPASELELISADQVEGRKVTRYQQVYKGVPIMGGELIVNATDRAELLSLSAEISPDLALDTNPSISPKQAQITALESMAKSHQVSRDSFEATDPELWIYDSRLLEPDGTPATLVWRLEVKSNDGSLPINELVLVDAKRGAIVLNFNQIDTAWVTGTARTGLSPTMLKQDDPPTDIPTVTPTPIVTETPAPDVTETPVTENTEIPTPTPENQKLIRPRTPGAATTYYVNIATGNDSNSCTTVVSPCQHIQQTINKASSGDTIYVASGTYAFSTNPSPNVLIIAKDLIISGGWNTTFTQQQDVSILNGANVNNVVLVNSGTVVFENFIIQNGNSGDGGGIYHYSGNLTLKSTTIKSNIASGNGGGIFLYNGSITIINSTISSNSAGSNGGGIYGTVSSNATVSIRNTTIAYNTAINGGGISRNTGSFTILNSIVANNAGTTSAPDCSGTINLANYNIIENNSGCTITTGSNNSNIDPQIDSNLTEAFLVHKLLAGSPAINGGDPNPVNCPSNDQIGTTRPYGGRCDIGAIEAGGKTIYISSGSNQTALINTAFAQPLVVYVENENFSPASGVDVTFTAPVTGASGTFSSTGTNITTVTTNASGIATTSTFTANNLGGANIVIASATGYSFAQFQLANWRFWYVSTTGNNSNSCSAPALPCNNIGGVFGKASFFPGNSIKISAGTYDQFDNTINKNVNISGGWSSNFTSQNGNTYITDMITVYPNTTVNIADINIKNIFGYDSGITNIGNLTLERVAIYENHVWDNGAGIYQNSGLLNLINVTISKNSIDNTSSGGTILSGAGIYINSGAVTINNSTITQNVVIDSEEPSQGGGIANPNNSPVMIMNSIVAGNVSAVGADCYGAITSGGHNLIGTSTDCVISSQSTDKFVTQGQNIKVMLGDLLDNGGVTLTHALLTGSSAIDAANPLTCMSADQRGTPRPQGITCDIGAYEGTATQTVIGVIRTYNAGNHFYLPGNLSCNQSVVSCANGPESINPDVVSAHTFAFGVYDFYNIHHSRISIDNNNMPIISSVYYCSTIECPYDNAFWSGTQMVYGQGYPAADDMVAHELTHGVTQYESNLFYYYQSGALSESFSDVWGELYDQQNGLGNDAANVKWLIGEDLPSGAMRRMSNPPAYNDPDKMTSSLYTKDTSDSGGVHSNSGINNKAAYLMVDGGSFNGKTVTAVGADKTLAIYYEVQTNLLTSGADYADLYNALYQGCLNLVGGSSGIVSGDCQQVRNATDSVEMNLQPVANFNTDAAMCSAGLVPNDTLYDNLESGTSNWTMVNGGTTRWQYGSPYGTYAHSGTNFLFADDYPATMDDVYVKLKPITIPANGYLHFAHAYDFEKYSNDPNYYDGGVLEYSTNNGASWLDAGSLIEANGYSGKISTAYNNPLKGRSAFVGASHGYISTRLKLSSLAGQSVTFRWRMGLDDGGSRWGWWLDDVHIYNCISGYIISGDVGMSGVTLGYTDGTAKIATSQEDGSYSLQVSSNWSGTVTPTHVCYTFDPTNRSYVNVQSHQVVQNYVPTALDPTCAIVNIDIGGANRGKYPLVSGESAVKKYALDGGPVEIRSDNGADIVASLYQLRRRPGTTSWTGNAQSMALPVEEISNKYVMPRYDYTSPSTMFNQVLIANVDTVSRDITVTIGGTVMGTYTLAPSESQYLRYSGVVGGPVVVSSVLGAKIVASLYALIRDPSLTGWIGQSEMMGLPGTQISDKYLIPMYFGASSPNTLKPYLYIANVDTMATTVEVKIAGVSRGTYPMQPNTSQVVSYVLDGGPVEISSNNGAKIVASLYQLRRRPGTTVWTGAAQSMALPVEEISNQYVMPRYDYTSPTTLFDQVLIANVDTVSRDITVKIGANVMGTYTLAPSASQYLRYDGVVGGPVVVSSVLGAKIVASLYELIRDPSKTGWIGQSEMMGLPGSQLSDKYLIPMYFGASSPNTLQPSLYIGVP